MRISKLWAELKSNGEVPSVKHNRNKNVQRKYREEKRMEADERTEAE